jgi:cell division protein FtsL
MNQRFRTFLTIVLFLGSIAVICVTLFFVMKEKKRARVIQDEIYALEQEKKRFEKENTALQDRIAYLQSAHSYEKEAKKLNYKNPGEQVVVVRRTKNEKSEDVMQENVEQEQEEKPHYKVWFDHFF